MIHMKFCSTALAGLPVDMTVSQNGVKRALSVEAFGVPKAPPVAPVPSAHLTITMRRGQQQIAPEGIAFFAEVKGFDSVKPTDGSVYDPTMHDIAYTWDFGDPGEFTALERMLPAWKDRNVGYGPFPAHVFATPGTYTVLCAAHERSSGKVAYGSIDVTVQDPEAVFTSAATICVDPDGDFTGAPTTEPLNRVTTWADAISRVKTFATGSVPVRLLFRSGKTIDATSRLGIFSDWKNGYISSWGGTARAKIRGLTPGVSGQGVITVYPQVQTLGVSISNLDIEGPWDPSLPGIKAGFPWVSGDLPPTAVYVRGGFVTVHNCDINGCNGIYYGISQTQGITTITSDTISRDWQDIGFFLDSEAENKPADHLLTNYHGLIGCRVTQHEQATMGGNGKNLTFANLDNQHGCIRIQLNAHVYIDVLEGFVRNGWTVTGGVPFEQQIIRDHRNNYRSRGFFSRIWGEGSTSLYTSGAVNTTFPVLPTNTVIDKAYHLAAARTLVSIGISCSAATVRNAILHRVNTKQGPDTLSQTMQLGSARADPSGSNEPIKAYNVTFVNELDGVNQPTSWAPFTLNQALYADGALEVANAVIHRPNHPTLMVADAPLDSTRLGITARYKGWRWRGYSGTVDKMTMDTSYATPPDSFALWRPLAGSPAIGSATGDLVAYDDLLGNVRPAQASRGATEPA